MDRSGRPVRPDRSAPPNNDPDPPRAEVLQRAESSHSRWRASRISDTGPYKKGR